uniref:Uncharacterized protein n=1 Tax=Macrostomum lignano TaxID=282301 RepID=A0A1I8FG62_9PLAT
MHRQFILQSQSEMRISVWIECIPDSTAEAATCAANRSAGCCAIRRVVAMR